jgi:hypothetical protein
MNGKPPPAAALVRSPRRPQTHHRREYYGVISKDGATLGEIGHILSSEARESMRAPWSIVAAVKIGKSVPLAISEPVYFDLLEKIMSQGGLEDRGPNMGDIE